MKRILCVFCCLCILPFMAGCTGSKNKLTTKEGFFFDTAISISIYNDDADRILRECFSLCKEIEETFSRTKEGSELYQLNHRQTNSVTLSEELAEVISCGIRFYELSDGYFDITIAPVLELWDFKGENPKLPDREAVAEALKLVDGSSIHLNGRELIFDREDTEIDLGALAKGFAADKLKSHLVEEGVTSGIIDLGGNVLVIGGKPDGSPWKVGIQKPFASRGEIQQMIEVRDKSVVSSGTYERYFEMDGVLYHHVLNPFTGYPSETETSQVTIVSNSSLIGDALSTTCILAGKEKAKSIAAQFADVELIGY